MNDVEIGTLLGIIKVAYPKFYAGDFDVDTAITLWSEMLSDLSLDEAKLAVKMHIGQSQWPPTIADIRKQVATLKRGFTLSADEAWGQVRRVISRYGSYREEDALDSLAPSVAMLVKRMGYLDLCMSENTMADRAHFMKLWERSEEKQDRIAMLPAQMHKIIQQVSAQKAIESERVMIGGQEKEEETTCNDI